jgi:hypothetical protein
MNETFPTIFELRATHAMLLAQHRKGTPFDALAPEVRSFVVRARQTGALLDAEEQRIAAQGLIDYWLTRLDRTNVPFEDATLVDFDESLAPELPDDACPYVGLEAFHEKDRPNFHGRSETLDRALQVLRERRFLAVIGPSGSGKSSIVLGGLLPMLKEGALEGSRDWRYDTPLAPGSASGKHLAATAAREGDVPLVVVVDQFEELFTLIDDGTARAAFAKRLVDIHKEGGVVIVTIREDYLPRLGAFPDLQELFRAGDLRATPLSASELRQAIEKPAERINLKLESGLVDALVSDVVGEPAALPLLQFTLWRLWTKRRRNRLTLEAYREVGGGRLALARAADEVFNGLIVQNQDTMRRILMRMVRPSVHAETTSSRVPIDALLRLGDDPARVQDVLNKLLAARLIRRTNDRVEVAHEALIRNWPKLVEWLESNKSAMMELRRFESLADEWVRFGRESGFLDEKQLGEAEEWLRSDEAKDIGVKDSLPALVAASRKKIDKETRRVRAAGAIVTLVMLALIIALTFTVMRLQKQIAELEDTREELTKSIEELKVTTKDRDESAQLATQLADVVERVNVFTSTAADLAPPPELQVRATAEYLRLREKTRPILAGSSIGRKGMVVSACCIVRDRKGQRFLLTMRSGASVGDRVLQPAPADGPGSVIGTIERVGDVADRERQNARRATPRGSLPPPKAPLRPNPLRQNRSGALVRLEPGVEMDQTIPNFGPISGAAQGVTAEEKLRAVGRGSGFTDGHVLVVRSGDIMTTVAFAPGDEGAPVVNVRNEDCCTPATIGSRTLRRSDHCSKSST